ncbi:concanavalin A-like lectin/glucanase domain-containing protein [Rhypophila decipiens]|uniref:Crh-like protein n=1 Tax=Rhypophila decipiens TaxID=261697 RepID=A0AAN6YJX7_9PEZI|nr:concanavalin A-like lectin/glucanase domain-containing protein [Rhypophila decipiens]
MLYKFATTVALAASLVSAQTHTVCNPLEKKCPNDKAVGSKPVVVDYTQGKNDFFDVFDGTTLTYDKDLGAVFSIENKMQAPTVGSHKTIFFGKVEVELRAAKGAGIVTSLVLQSLDLDEIDWEWIGNDVAQVQTNYFSKGCDKVFDRGTYEPVANPQDEFHTYTIEWTPKELKWIINGQVVRTLVNTGLEGCSGYPQTPMQIKLGTWVGGRDDKPEGTVTWAGGLANFDEAPFKGYYRKVTIVDYMGGDGTPGSGAKEATEYQWTDHSGHADSIKVLVDGKSDDSEKTTTSSSKTSTKTAPSTTLTTVTSSGASSTPSASGSSTPSDSETSGTGTGTGGAGPTNTGGAAPSQSTGPVNSGSDKLALPLGVGLAALIAALL